MTPAPTSAANAVGEKPKTAGRLPVTSAATKNSGTPSGTVIAMPCMIDPVRTARRMLALRDRENAQSLAETFGPREFRLAATLGIYGAR